MLLTHPFTQQVQLIQIINAGKNKMFTVPIYFHTVALVPLFVSSSAPLIALKI